MFNSKLTFMETGRIYVGTYHKYNCGSIDGKWLDLDEYSDISEFYEACKELHKDESDPEFMFQDYENIPECFIGESWLSEKYFEFIQLDFHDQDTTEAFNHFLDHFGYDMQDEDISDLKSKFEDCYQGHFSSSLEFSEQLFDELYLHDVPASVQYYIDYEKFDRDLFQSDYTEIDGHIFCTNW